MSFKKLFPTIALFLVLLHLISCSGCPGQETGESGSEAAPSGSSKESVVESSTESLSEDEPSSGESDPSGSVPGKNSSETENTTESETSESESDSDDSSESESETEPESTTEPPHVHKLEFTAGVYPTCTEPGHYEYYRCSGCGACFFDKDMQVPFSSFDEIVIPPTGHKMIYHPSDSPDCDEVGVVTPYYECENCGNWFFDDQGLQLVEDHEALVTTGSHQLSHVEGIEPSCKNFGVKEHWKCAICFRRFYDEKAEQPVEDPEKDLVIEALPHDLQKVDTAEATCGQDGVKTVHYQCKACGSRFYDEKGEEPADPKDVIIPATGEHDLEHVPEREATETEDGMKEHWRCKVCGGLFLDEKGEKPVKSQEELVIPKKNSGEESSSETENSTEQK